MFAKKRTPKRWEEAASWHARMIEPASAQEVAEFEAWLRRDPKNAKAYAEIESVMAAVGEVPRQIEPERRMGSTLLRPALAFGLAIVVVVCTAGLWQGASAPAFATIANKGSAVRGVQLEDGTRVWLDIGAEIGVRLAVDQREIEIRAGRVRVAPAPDARPLAIRSDSARITPGTTRTDVMVAGGRVTLGAVDGPIAVEAASRASGRASLRLDAGRALAFEAGVGRAVLLDRTWIAGRLRFSNTALQEILSLANRLGDPDIVAGDGDVAQLRVSGVFDLRETRALARKLAATLELRVEEADGRLTLSR